MYKLRTVLLYRTVHILYATLETLQMLCYASIHSVISYGIIFWGNCSYNNTIFKWQTRAIRIIMNAGNRQSCRELFRELNILPLHSQYIFSLSLFVVKQINMFRLNSMIHSINARHCSDLHLPSVRLTKAQKGVYYSGIDVFNSLPAEIKGLSGDIGKFKTALKGFLLEWSFYTLHEYFDRELISE